MQTLVLHNFAGMGCNLVKYLTWSLLFSENTSVKVLFYYRNKGSANDDWRAVNLQRIEDMVEKNIFYKFFQYPSGCSPQLFTKDVNFTLGYPSEIPITSLPACLRNYPLLFPSQVKEGKVSLSFGGQRVFYTDSLLPYIRQAYFEQIEKNLKFQPSFWEEIQKELRVIQEKQLNGKKVFAAFLRSTEHFNGSVFSYEALFQEIKESAESYDSILITTQIEPMVQKAKQMLGNKAFFFDRKRLKEDKDWEKNISDEQFEEEVKMAIIDSYLMSQCDAIVSGISNMLLMSIFWNQTVPFTLFREIKGDETC